MKERLIAIIEVTSDPSAIKKLAIGRDRRVQGVRHVAEICPERRSRIDQRPLASGRRRPSPNVRWRAPTGGQTLGWWSDG